MHGQWHRMIHTLKPGAQFRPESDGRVSRPDPGHRSYFSFATFSDPDGNTWLFQESTMRLPGRGLSNLDVSTLTELLRETEQLHCEYEPTAEAPLVGVVRRLHGRAT